jgi:hypothetical protein
MGLCLTKQNNVEEPRKIEEAQIIKPKIDIKFIDINEILLNKTKKKSLCYKRIIFKSKITIKAVNKIRLRKKHRYNKRPPFK